MHNLDPASVSYLVMDFDGVMTDDSVYVDESGAEMVKCSRFDGAGISLLRKANELGLVEIEMLIISSESNEVALRRADKLKIPCEIGVIDKYDYLCKRANSELNESHDDFFSKTIYMGNDLNDLRSIRKSKVSIVPSNSHALVKKAADIVLPEKGGEGFVRAAIEIILGATVIESTLWQLYG
jgi:YrbI family 3-deoxy-D-manno-octulosonate 8-phosphate phosphatase